jgi:hypothetical protein
MFEYVGRYFFDTTQNVFMVTLLSDQLSYCRYWKPLAIRIYKTSLRLSHPSEKSLNRFSLNLVLVKEVSLTCDIFKSKIKSEKHIRHLYEDGLELV